MSKELFWTIAFALLGMVSAFGGKHISDSYWSSYVANISVTLIGVSIGLFLVNHYLNREAKKAAVQSLLRMIAPSIQQYHNDLVSEAWGTFGRPQWAEMIQRYVAQDGDPLAFNPTERDQIYAMIKKDEIKYKQKLKELDSEMRELVSILGWSFDPSILASAFNCRYAIVKFCAISFDDSIDSKKAALEHFLDAEIMATEVHDDLAKLVGLKIKDIYGS